MLVVVQYLHIERSDWPATLSCTTISIFNSKINILSQRVFYLIFVGSFETSKCFQKLNFLLYQELINLSEILETFWTTWYCCWWWHPLWSSLLWSRCVTRCWLVTRLRWWVSPLWRISATLLRGWIVTWLLGWRIVTCRGS